MAGTGYHSGSHIRCAVSHCLRPQSHVGGNSFVPRCYQVCPRLPPWHSFLRRFKAQISGERIQKLLRTLDNYGTINWTGNALLYSYGLFNNYGSGIVSAVGTPQYVVVNSSLPSTFNNYGTFTRTNGTVFYFNGDYVNNYGLMEAQAGTLSIYNSTMKIGRAHV